MTGYVDMKLDYSFKKIFSDMSILRNFLNDVLRGERTVEEVEPRNPEWQPESPDDRKVLVDVYCRSKDGTYFIVEMQYTDQKFFRDRALFYDCACIFLQGKKGREWRFEILPVVSIYVLNFVLHKDKSMDKYRTDVGITDLDSGEIYNPKVRDIFIELPKFNKELRECEDDSERWIYYIKNMEHLDTTTAYYPFAKGSKFGELLEAGLLANYTPEERRQYYQALKIYRDSKNIYDTAVENSFESGLLKGKQEVAQQMKQQGLPINTIAVCTGLTEEEIEQL